MKDSRTEFLKNIAKEQEKYEREEQIKEMRAKNLKSRLNTAEALLEKAAEEIENVYGKETELSEKIRTFLGK